jgi:hypothetical protein
MSAAYVCFSDDSDADYLFLIAQSKWWREAMIERGIFQQLSRVDQVEMKKDFLIVRPYFKGVPQPEREFLDRDGDSYVSDTFQFDKKSAKLRMTVVWDTLRFKRVVEAVRTDGARIPYAELFGRCEPVSPTVQQHGN